MTSNDQIDEKDSIINEQRSINSSELLKLESRISSVKRNSIVSNDDANIHIHLKMILNLIQLDHKLISVIKIQTVLKDSRCVHYLCVISHDMGGFEEYGLVGLDIIIDEVSDLVVCFVMGIWKDFLVTLDGDGGLRLKSGDRIVDLKPVSVAALWSSFQHLKVARKAAIDQHCNPIIIRHSWLRHYDNKRSQDIEKNPSNVVAWERSSDVTQTREEMLLFPSNFSYINKNSESDALRTQVSTQLKEIFSSADDIDSITVIKLRQMCENYLHQDLRELKNFISQESMKIYGQMNKCNEIFPFLYLGSSHNAADKEELERKNIFYICNVTKEVENFFEDDKNFVYLRIRVEDLETEEIWRHWDDTHRFINAAKTNGKSCLVHCQMGISRSASTVIAYVMKEFKWSLAAASDFVRARRKIIKPNSSFQIQLETYEGILAKWNERSLYEAKREIGEEDANSALTKRNSAKLRSLVRQSSDSMSISENRFHSQVLDSFRCHQKGDWVDLRVNLPIRRRSASDGSDSQDNEQKESINPKLFESPDCSLTVKDLVNRYEP